MSRQANTLDEIVDHIVGNPGVADGSVAPLGEVTSDEASVVLREFYRSHDDADRFLPVVAEQMERRIACHEGCSTCCQCLILVSVPEARELALAVSQHPNKARIVERSREWAAVHGDRAMAAAKASGDREPERYATLLREHALDRTMCPVNEDGRCMAYSVRPLPCRQSWALDTAEYCAASRDPDAPKGSFVTHAQYEEFIATGRRVTAGLQAAMGHAVARQPLVLALLEELERAADPSTDDDP